MEESIESEGNYIRKRRESEEDQTRKREEKV
jgi:hypothetical protein